jgi:hypothetical protein
MGERAIMTKRARWVGWGAVLGVSAALAAGCGSSGSSNGNDDENDSGSLPDSTTDSPAQEAAPQGESDATGAANPDASDGAVPDGATDAPVEASAVDATPDAPGEASTSDGATAVSDAEADVATIVPAEASTDSGLADSAADVVTSVVDSAVDTGVADAGPDTSVAEASVDSGAVAEAAASSDASDAGPDARVCTDDLSNIGTADFTISVTLATTQSGQVAVVSQRDVCGHSMFWDIRLDNGFPEVETDDGAGNYTDFDGTTLVNDGATHVIEVERVSETITLYVDGVASGSAASVTPFGALPALAVGTDICVGTDATVAFSGTETDVCVSSP